MTESLSTTATPSPEFRPPDQNNLSSCKGPSVQAPSWCYDAADAVNIHIYEEDDCHTYTIPKGLLTWDSSYFAAALDPSNAETFAAGAVRDLELEEDVEVFEAFYCWLHTGRLLDPPDTTEEATVEDLYLYASTLCQVWVFADIRGVPALKNAAIDMLHERTCAVWKIHTKSLSYVYENTTRGSELRKYMVDTIIKTRNYDRFRHSLTTKDLPADFLAEAIPILVRHGEDYGGMEIQDWTSEDRCQWHDHSGLGGKLRLESRK